MVNILRRWNQPIMVVITVLVIVSFVYWGPSMGRQNPQNAIALKLYNQGYKIEEFKRLGRRLEIFRVMGGLYYRTVHSEQMDPRNQNRGEAEAVARGIVLDHECEALGITSTPAERLAILETLDGLKERGQFGQPTGAFDPRAFVFIKERFLIPNGFSENDFDRVFLDGEVRVKKLLDLIGQTTTVLPDEIREIAVQSEFKVDASYLAFKRADLRKEIKVTDDEIKKAYEEGKGTYKTAELRKVRFAAFLRTEPDGKTSSKSEEVAQMQKLVNTAYDFAQALKKQPNANFEELAKKAGATVGETKDFFPENTPPAELDNNDQLAEAAFQLSKENPYSSQISVNPKGSYVLAFGEVKAPEQQALEAVKDKIQAKLLDAKSKDLALVKAKEAQPKIAEALKAGKKFPEAVQALNLKAEEFPSFSLNGRPQNPYSPTVIPATLKLAPGEISEALADAGSGDAVIVHLDSRSAGDEAKIAAKIPNVKRGFTDFLQGEVFAGWLRQREIAAGVPTAFGRQLQD